ncbi:hypothetical protein BC826DRAFT_86011 [Russula brevipes]|nr:hypothetical protein BC826DRAFT_86011 [Russula brevipes]
MPSSRSSSARKTITVLSIAALGALSFIAMLVAIVHPQALDSIQAGDSFLFPKRYTPHGRRTFRFARAPQATTPASNPSPNVNPAATQAPTPTQAPAVASPAPSNPAPAPVAAPSPSAPPAPAAQPPSPSPAPSSAPAQAAPPASSNPATPAAASQPPASPVAPAPSSGVAASSPQATTSSNTGRVVTNLSNYPPTTFVFTGQSQTPTSIPTSSSAVKIVGPTQTISAPPTDGATTPTGFFQNKNAVGVTFGIVGGVCVLLVVLGARFYSKRFRRRQRDEEDFFEKFPIPDGDGDEFARHSAAFGAGTPGGGSVVDINGSPLASAGVYPDRPAYYGNPTPGPVYNTGIHGLAAPSGLRNSVGSVNSLPRSGPIPGHPFADPVNASNSSVSQARPLPARMQEIVATDSYYGSDAVGSDTNSMGYAQ